MIVASPPRVAFVCPRCHGAVDESPGGYRCARCPASYPIVAGIPDFRVAPDPWIGLEDDREKARRLEVATTGMGFEDATRAYWAMTPTTPSPQAERFIRHVLGAAERSHEWLEERDREERRAPEGPWLDLGCGTADLMASVPPTIPVVGVDIALRWLVVARKRPGVSGPGRALVSACAEALPFPPGSFARVLSLGTLEHCTDPAAAVAEGRRVLARGGTLLLRTTNRYTLLPEPHVGVWGVGFVPRRWADGYVRRWSGHRYLHHRPLSPREVRGHVAGAGFTKVGVRAATLLPSERKPLGPAARAAAATYEGLRRLPVARAALAWIAHLLEVRGEVPS